MWGSHSDGTSLLLPVLWCRACIVILSHCSRSMNGAMLVTAWGICTHGQELQLLQQPGYPQWWVHQVLHYHRLPQSDVVRQSPYSSMAGIGLAGCC